MNKDDASLRFAVNFVIVGWLFLVIGCLLAVSYSYPIIFPIFTLSCYALLRPTPRMKP